MRRRFVGIFLALGFFGSAAWAQGDAPVTSTTQTTSTTTTTAAPAELDPPPFSTHEGWNGRWSMLFSLNNFFVVGNVFAAPVDGTIGGDLHFSNRTALRLGLSLGHTNSPAQVTKVVTTVGDQTIATYTVNPVGFTDTWLVNVRAAYLWRLLESPVSPYLGVGGQVGWTLDKLGYTDDKSVLGQRTQINNATSSISISARALAGAEWRFHPSFAVYVDYSVNLALYTNNHAVSATTVENTNSGTTSTSRTVSTRDVNSLLNLSTALNQGASLGFKVFF